MTNSEIIQHSNKGGIDVFLEYKKGILNRSQFESFVCNLMDLARTDERTQHAKKNSKQFEIKFNRGYAGWTPNAVVVVGTDQWVSKKFITNWTGDEPPKEIEATVPEWFYKIIKDIRNVELIKELN